MTSNPPCCPPGSWPQLLIPKDELNQDEPPPTMGSVVTVKVDNEDGGSNNSSLLPIYFVEPPSTKKFLGSIMVLPDIFSIRVLSPENNVRSGDRIGLICDVLAQTGYTVALPSIFRDKPFDEAVAKPSNGNFIGFDCFGQQGGVDWFKEQTYDKVGPDVKACAKFLSEKTNGQALGVVGFCYGSWLLAKASSMGDVDFACAIGYHPSTKLEAFFGGDEIAMLNNGIKMPTKFLSAGNDSEIYNDKNGKGKAALEKSGGGVVEFPDMLHGWVSRGDVSDVEVKHDVQKAMDLTVEFLAKMMPKVV